MKSLKSYFIWTEAFNCGEILNPMLASFLKHHDFPIHVFASDSDFQEVDVKSHLLVHNPYPNKLVQDKIEKKVDKILWSMIGGMGALILTLIVIAFKFTK